MNGSQLKQKFDEAVEYANAEPFNIRFSESNGKISPSGIQSLKVSDQLFLTFSADSDWCFLKWQVFSNGELLSDEETSKTINFDDINSPETSIKILQNLPELTVQAKCEPRPKVVSVSPAYESDGVYRDRRIIVMFDKTMDKNSIYFSNEELVDLKILSDDETVKPGYKLLKSVDGCYGYEKSGEPESTVFKNIKITDRKTGENYLQHFSEPIFDKDDLSTLRVSTKIENPPPSATEILVTVNKDLYINKGIRINLSADYSWAYYTNGKTDNDSPSFIDFDVRFASDEQSNYSSTNKKVVEDVDIFDSSKSGFSSNNYKENYLANKKLWVKGSFADTGSGPRSLKWILAKTNSSFYPCEDKEITMGQIDDIEIIGSKAEIRNLATGTNEGIRIDLDDQLNGKKLEDGLYRLDFICSDRNEMETKKSFYFVHDTTPPNRSSAIVVSKSRNEAELKITNPDKDYEKSVISSVTFNNGNLKTVSNLPGSGRTHTVSITDYDIYGNSKTSNITIDTTPLVGMIFYSDKTWSNEYIEEKTPIGVVCEASDLSSIKIWDIYEYTGYTWGNTGKPCGDEQLRYEDYWVPEEGNKKLNVSGGLDWLNLINNNFPGIRRSDSIWTFVNNRNASSPVTWYIPGVLEYRYLLHSYNSMKGAYTILKKAGYDATLISAGQPYWTGVPRFHNEYAYVVQFKTRHKDSDNRYGCDWTVASNSSSEMENLYVTSTHREGGWYYKDRNYDTARGVTYYLRTHAMAQIDMR